jgi:hypothetical protein
LNFFFFKKTFSLDTVCHVTLENDPRRTFLKFINFASCNSFLRISRYKDFGFCLLLSSEVCCGTCLLVLSDKKLQERLVRGGDIVFLVQNISGFDPVLSKA